MQLCFCAVMPNDSSFRRPCSDGLTCANYSKTFIDVATDMSIRAPYLKAASTFSQSSLYSASSSAETGLLPTRSSLAMLELYLESVSPATHSRPAEVAQNLLKPAKTHTCQNPRKPSESPVWISQHDPSHLQSEQNVSMAKLSLSDLSLCAHAEEDVYSGTLAV